MSLEEIDYLETPTQVIASLTDSMLCSQHLREFASRICGVGYDMMCCLYKRMRTLIKDELLDQERKSLLIHLLGYLFVDAFHVRTHRNPLCKNAEGGLFHPHLTKFKGILWGRQRTKNDSVAEQLWKKTNGLKVAKNMGRPQMKVFLTLFRKRHNERSTKRLFKAGYTRIDLNRISKVRNLDELKTELPETVELIEDEQYQELGTPHLL